VLTSATPPGDFLRVGERKEELLVGRRRQPLSPPAGAFGSDAANGPVLFVARARTPLRDAVERTRKSGDATRA